LTYSDPRRPRRGSREDPDVSTNAVQQESVVDPVIRRVLRLELTGLVAVHAVRAVHTALGAVEGIETARVNMTGAEVEVTGPYDSDTFAAAVRAALEPVGVGLTSITLVQGRSLPLA
jgi:copper chaperone CopZ